MNLVKLSVEARVLIVLFSAFPASGLYCDVNDVSAYAHEGLGDLVANNPFRELFLAHFVVDGASLLHAVFNEIT